MSAVPLEDTIDEHQIEAALQEAHIPSLMAALVHLTGDAGHINDENKPVYDFFGDGQGNINPEMRAQMRVAVRRAYATMRAAKTCRRRHPATRSAG
jgi:4-hydroxyacetophenone monooxygenase